MLETYSSRCLYIHRSGDSRATVRVETPGHRGAFHPNGDRPHFR